MTNYFEQSVQLVDKSFSLFYWDYTIETASGIDISDSPMFQSSTFGSISAPKEWKYSEHTILDARIPDGRWKHLPSEINTKFTELYSTYGYMRAPWSCNPSPYITRFTANFSTLPTCQYIYEGLQFDTLNSYITNVRLDPHGTAHLVPGGIFGCDALSPLLDKGIFTSTDNMYSFCHTWVIHLKEFYRNHHITPSTNCYVENSDYSDPKNFQCSYQCDESAEAKESFIDALDEDLYTSSMKSDMSSDDFESIREFICNGDAHHMFAGDHLEAASASDPSFWPIHPTIERMLQAKYMSGGFFNSSWYKTATDLDYVCSFTECYDQDTGEYGRWRSCCDGITNGEALELTNPLGGSYGMNYIYDNFDYSHCQSTDYDIDELLATYATSNE
eukprot:gene21755-28154_t